MSPGPAADRDADAAIGWRAALGFAFYALSSAVALFLAAGTLRWTMGWVYVGSAQAVTLASRLLVLRADPSLLRERARFVQAEGAKPWDRRLVPLVALVGPLLTAVIAGLDHRFGWQPAVPPALQWAAVAVLLAGYGLAAWAMAVNRFFSATVRIQTDRGHTVVSDGPYRWVRHPGYAGGLLSYLAVPILLDALWALVPVALLMVGLAVRTVLEDRTLHDELPGYRDYAARVPYRLLPGVW